MFIAPTEVLIDGLDLVGVRYRRWSAKTRALEFHRHYGSSPLDIADIWYDLVQGDYLPDELKLASNEKNKRGFKKYMMCQFWLWIYPKNSSLLATSYKTCERYCRGEHIWKWVKRIASLKAKKIKWENAQDPERLEIIGVSVDGVDFHLREEKHPTLPRDNKACSHKFKKAAAKYEIVLSVHRAKVVHIAGPFKGGKHDTEMFRTGGLRDKLRAMNQVVHGTKKVFLCLADRGYHSDERKFPGDNDLFALPNSYDLPDLNNYKSRGRLRQETFNSRIKCFNSLSLPFRHGFKKHKFVFEAVVVIVQYQMDNGSPIYAI